MQQYQAHFGVGAGRGCVLLHPKHILFTILGAKAALKWRIRVWQARVDSERNFRKCLAISGWGIILHNSTLGLLGSGCDHSKQNSGPVKLQSQRSDLLKNQTVLVVVLARFIRGLLSYYAQHEQHKTRKRVMPVIWALPPSVEEWFGSLHDPKEAGCMSRGARDVISKLVHPDRESSSFKVFLCPKWSPPENKLSYSQAYFLIMSYLDERERSLLNT